MFRLTLRSRTGRAVLLALGIVILVPLARASSARTTAIIAWNPLTAAGEPKPALKLRRLLGKGRCDYGSEVIGNFGYRCGTRNLIGDPCWRNGPAPTNLVICPSSPWSKTVDVIRVPYLMLAAGVTIAERANPMRDPPFGLQLWDGNRCLLTQGAHDVVSTKHRARYHLQGRVAIRQAIFPSLPRAMRPQNRAARAAAAASGFDLARVLRVRISFPALDWANVEALNRDNIGPIEISRAVHRTSRGWHAVHLRRRPCRSRMPRTARDQLFGCGLSRSLRAELFLGGAPVG